MSNHPLVVHCKRDQYDVYVGRPSKWGNPFAIGIDGNRDDVIEKFRLWFITQPGMPEAAKLELKGKVLGCWCAPNKCHADVLAEVANG